jgi:hypothetical protein
MALFASLNYFLKWVFLQCTGNLVASGDHGVLMVEYQLYHRQGVEQTRCQKPKHLISLLQTAAS